MSLETLGHAGDSGAQAHYEDAAYYTKTYRSRTEDVRYYVAQAKRSGGPVLEYGIGNGRIGLAMAEAGIEVFGVDLSAAMLGDLKARLQQAPKEVRRRVRYRRGDMRSLRLRRRFPLVIAPFNCVLHLYTRQDVEQFLARVREHLAPGGRFVFDFSLPQPEDLCRDPNRAYGAPPVRHPTTGSIVRYKERFEYDPLRQLLLVWMDFIPKDGAKPWSVPLTHRQFFPREMEALLHYNGFGTIVFTSDFTDLPPDETTDSLVASCKIEPPRSLRR